MRHHLHQTFIRNAVYFFRRHRVCAITIGTPQQQQIAQTLQTRGRASLNHGISALSVQLNGRNNSNRITFRETSTQTRGDQHIANANVGVSRQVFELKIVGATVTRSDHADIITQYLNGQRMRRIANQQHAAGQFSHRHDLTYYAFVANNRLAFVDAVNAPFVDHDLIAVRVINR